MLQCILNRLFHFFRFPGTSGEAAEQHSATLHQRHLGVQFSSAWCLPRFKTSRSKYWVESWGRDHSDFNDSNDCGCRGSVRSEKGTGSKSRSEQKSKWSSVFLWNFNFELLSVVVRNLWLLMCVVGKTRNGQTNIRDDNVRDTYMTLTVTGLTMRTKVPLLTFWPTAPSVCHASPRHSSQFCHPIPLQFRFMLDICLV